MNPELLGIIMLLALLTGIFAGFPISFTLLFLATAFGYVGFGDTVFHLTVFQTIGIMKEEALAAVPLFVFMGHILERAGLMERLFRSFQFIIGGVRGSLYLGVLLTATIFAAATGIVGASVTVIGMLAAPAMVKSGYSPSMSAGVITAGGSLGVVIPPSVMLVVMGPVLGISVVHLFAAAIIPGLLLAGIYIAYTMIRCWIDPELGPVVPKEERAGSTREAFKEFCLGIFPLSFVVFAALGSILAGLATPTEAAAMAATGSVVLALAYRRLSWVGLKEACIKTLHTTSLVMFLAMASNVYGSVFTRLGSGTVVAEWMLSLPLPPWGMLILLLIIIFLLGWPLEWPAIIFIFVPIFLPVILELDLDLIWFGTLLAVVLQTAYLSPPVAMAAYYLKAVAPQWSLMDIYRGMAQFMMLQIVVVIIVFAFPAVATWLPTELFGAAN